MTEAQINANRENAKKSTGPRTAEGKNASSRNRLLHGLRANKHILLDEDPEDFLLLLHDHWDRFQPVGPAEETLVLRIANGQWRLGRALPAEAGIYRDRFHEVFQKDEARWKHYEYQKSSAEKYSDPTPAPPATPVPGDLLARAFNVDCEGPNSLARLARYETSIEHSIDRCIRQLKICQAARTTASPSDPSPQVPDMAPQAGPPPDPPAEPVATPSDSMNCHSNPNAGTAPVAALSGAAVMALMLYALLQAVPELIAAIASLLTGSRLIPNRAKIEASPLPRRDTVRWDAVQPRPRHLPRRGFDHRAGSRGSRCPRLA
ncbi:MAG TPA: hypothetical protein VMQ86_21445 [Bryobacteraceae bacterium]|jgi:hypothetical protein|nr:hypothetical protein [Bryobacteraceae bacterium]